MSDHPAPRDDEKRLFLLVLRCQAGDETAFSRLMTWFGGRTLAHLRGLVGDEAEDVQQDVWLTVYTRIGALSNPRAFRTWLFQTTRHRAIDFLRSRKRALLAFLGLNAVAVVLYFLAARTDVLVYACIFVLGIANGYWAVFVTVAGEQFGTNLRATAATTAPNFVRGSLVLTTFVFEATRVTLGIWQAAAVIGVVITVLSFVALAGLEETYGKELDFVER